MLMMMFFYLVLACLCGIVGYLFYNKFMTSNNTIFDKTPRKKEQYKVTIEKETTEAENDVKKENKK